MRCIHVSMHKLQQPINKSALGQLYSNVNQPLRVGAPIKRTCSRHCTFAVCVCVCVPVLAGTLVYGLVVIAVIVPASLRVTHARSSQRMLRFHPRALYRAHRIIAFQIQRHSTAPKSVQNFKRFTCGLRAGGKLSKRTIVLNGEHKLSLRNEKVYASELQ